jgi:hypothetical protein
MRLNAITNLFKSKRFWVWQIGGAIIYALPVLIRVATGNVLLPGLSLRSFQEEPEQLQEKSYTRTFTMKDSLEDKNIWLVLEAHYCGQAFGHFFSFGGTFKT